MKRWKCLCTLCCSDTKLTTFLSILDRGDARPHYVNRNLGLPFAWNNPSEPDTLMKWYRYATSFKGINAPITGGLVFSHTNCVAVATNGFFEEARVRRAAFPMTPEGELAFCLEELELVRVQTQQVPPLPNTFQSTRTRFDWYFGVVDTHRAELLSPTATLRDAARCITWLDGVPDFFERRLHSEEPEGRVVDGQSAPHDANRLVHHTPHGSIVTS